MTVDPLNRKLEAFSNVGVGSKMTTRYTDDEWLAMIDQAEQNLSITNVKYKAPSLGTEAFANYIDHTLLKLNATKEQVDGICDQARQNNFKVCSLPHS